MPLALRTLIVYSLCGFLGPAAFSQADTDTRSPPAILPVESEPLPRLITYPPLAEPLARGVVIIQFRTEHVRIMPVFGKTAGDVSPRLGHLHVTVDDWKGTWAHTNEDPIILVGLTPGTHRVLLEVADPTHKILTSATESFKVPEKTATGSDMSDGHAAKP
ncbi:hypothetical protein D3C73_725680 [compost metagenome]